ncbi:MAG TPA: lysophospholipid acyltransferase family protein [Candidatus Limnocylindria bacterium]|nr:lysophospholipid acyltransferase family protein [Candidatus Limnocylindria bacterium]
MRSWFHHPGCAIVGFFARLLWRARIEGVEHLPRTGPFILVANHCSNLDPLMMGWASGHQIGRVVHFMAKIEMRHWPIIGWLATQAGVYFVRRGERDRAAQQFSLEALAAGKPIAIFPEGTRSRDGHLRPGKPGAALLAIRSGAPIVPAGISGTHRIFPNGAKIPRLPRVRIVIGEPFTLPHQPSGRLDREALAAGTERIMAAIEALLPEEQRRRTGAEPDPTADLSYNETDDHGPSDPIANAP